VTGIAASTASLVALALGIAAIPIAMLYAGLGDLDQTFAWLEKSVDDRSINSGIVGPTFQDLRADPRF
jgi:hypothetical protein